MWQQVGIIAPGGTVFNIVSGAEGRLWLATGAGIFRRDDGAWHPLRQAQPVSQLTALTSAGSVLLASGGLGQIAYSTNGGETWYQGRLGQVEEPVTCLVASPAFQHDGVVLAGTEGAGILRSTDGGRNWDLSNFGLQDFSIIALATTPEWGRREVVFAATAHGLYRSPNGGRAWKKSDAGLGDAIVLSLAASPNFAQDSILFAGTEANGLFRSTDGGKTWHPWGQGLGMHNSFPPVNALWLHPNFAAMPVCLAGMGDGRLFRSQDGGAHWTCVTSEHAPVFCLANVGAQLYAGLHEQGLLSSHDDGRTWAQERELAVRAITRLVRGSESRELFAFGPFEGAWRSVDGGKTWARVKGLEDQGPILALAASPQAEHPCLLVGTGNGLLRSDDGGQRWQTVLPGKEVVVIRFSPGFNGDGVAWVGTGTGELLASSDGGLTWTACRSPSPGAPVVVLDARLGSSGADVLVAATFHPQEQQLTLWRSADGGQVWEQWLRAPTSWPAAHLALSGLGDPGSIVCTDRMCWQLSPQGWERILETDTPIVHLCRVPDTGDLIVLTSTQLLRSVDGVNWSSFDEGLTVASFADMVFVPTTDDSPCAYLLSTGGMVWRRSLAVVFQGDRQIPVRHPLGSDDPQRTQKATAES